MDVYLWSFALNVFSIKAYTSAFLLIPSSDRATTGIDFNFTCFYTFTEYVIIYKDNQYEFAVRGFGDCSVAYDRNGYFNYTCNENILVLVIPATFDIDTLHGSSWYCRDFHTKITNTVMLYVNVPITYVNLTVIPYDKNPMEILSGSTQQFQCTTNAGRPSSRIEWYISGANITENAVFQTDQCNLECNETLISSSVLKYTGNITDIGKTIYCIAENVKEQSVRSIDRRIDILYPPVIVDIPDHNIIEGNTVYIIPSIDANPNAMSVWWTRQNDTSYIYNGMNLTINNIQRNFGDYYKCNAMNTITTSSQTTQNKTTAELFKVNVLYQPSVYMEPLYNPLIVQEYQQNIRLSCMIVEANPVDDLTYQWNYPAGTIKNGVLTIPTVSKMHYGLYSCSATNSVGSSAIMRKQIDVHYEPVISGIQDYNIKAGRTLNVTPTVDAYPPPTSIWWTRQNDIKFVHFGWNLTIINIQEKDSDNYTCHVMNTLTPSGLSAQNRTSITFFNINVQKIHNEDSINSAAFGVGMGIAVILLILGATSVFIFLYRKRRMTKRRENSNSKVYESELDKPRSMRIVVTGFLRGGLRSGHYAYGKYVGELLPGSKQLKISKLLLNVDKLKNFPQKKQTSGVDNHLYNELQDLKSDGKQQHRSSERCSNTYEEFGEVKNNANDNIYENMKISTNEIQIRQKDTNLYVNLELKPSTRT